jgi:hypothetical protein
MRTNRRVYVWALGLGLLAGSPALAVSREAALGGDGEVYAVRAGSYGELFPAGKDFDPVNPVIALDITKPKTLPQRILVPGTGGPEVERSPSVLFEEGSQTAFLVWESEFNFHPILQLAGFDGRAWTRPIEVIGNPFAPKTSLQFTTTRDAYQEPGPDNSTVTRHRTFMHLFWQEETASGWATFYSPILIDDRGYLGWNPVYNLDEYLQDRVTPATAEVQAALAKAPIIMAGRDERTVVLAYASTALGRLAAIEVDVLPEELTRLADATRARILELGQDYFPSDLASLAQKARSHIVDLGHAFRAEVVHAMAEQVKALILAGGSGGLEALADKARSHIVDLGAQLSDRGLRGANGADATAKLLEVAPDPTTGAPEAPGSLLFQLRMVSNLPVPRIGPGTVRLLVSDSGENLIISWAQADKVLYRNSRGSGWSDVRELRFSDSLDLTKAYEILEQRLSKR